MTTPRLILMAMPPLAVRRAMEAAVARNGLDSWLGECMFSAGNWHQTFSDRYPDERAFRQQLLQAGARVSAQAFTMTLNRLRDHSSDGTIHWTFRVRGIPAGFTALLAAVRNALIEQGIEPGTGHTPHVTLSYRAPERLGATAMAPIPWTVDELLLVVGGGRPYHYEIIGRWTLQPHPQLTLF